MNLKDIMMAIPDVQSSLDSRHLPINKVGIKSIRHPVKVLDKSGGVQHTIATFNMYVGLPHNFKGTHMSRFVEILNAHEREISVESFESMLREMVQKLEAKTGHLEMSFPYFINKSAPVSKVKSLLDYEVTFLGEIVEGDGYRQTTSVIVPATSLCPCSKKISERGAHNQRSHITITATTNSFVWRNSSGWGLWPIVGDWDGNGIDSFGLYNRATSEFYLKNSNIDGVTDISFVFGWPTNFLRPIAGDWDGNGTDTVGLYNPSVFTFFLNNAHAGGTAWLMIGFGPANGIPVIGDWDNDGADTLGVYKQADGILSLRNSNTSGIEDIRFSFGPTGKHLLPVAGNWGSLPTDFGCSAANDLSEEELCGNGTVDAFEGEQCDDHNQVSGDGCTASCRYECTNAQLQSDGNKCVGVLGCYFNATPPSCSATQLACQDVSDPADDPGVKGQVNAYTSDQYAGR